MQWNHRGDQAHFWNSECWIQALPHGWTDLGIQLRLSLQVKGTLTPCGRQRGEVKKARKYKAKLQ